MSSLSNGVLKFIGGLVGIFITVLGAIWGAYEVLDLRMENKVIQGKKEILEIISVLKDERNAKIQTVDQKIIERSSLLEGKIDAVNGKVDILIRLATSEKRRRDSFSARAEDTSEKLTMKIQKEELSGSL